ncbi:MAG TPA: YidB family protein [Steroidobacteraceae bacterium]|jgi:uncharacterized protein YidB (DUF937 family)
MGLLDSIVGSMSGNSQGGQGALVQEVVAMLASNSKGGGLTALIQSFESSGLGNIVSSWVGTGQNLPISAQQVQQGLGSDRIGQLAQSLGLQNHEVSGHLAELLPQLINQLTPNGQIPAGGVEHTDIAGALSGILGQLTGGGATSRPGL